MKPFLGIDVTTDKKNQVYNGEEFIVQKTSKAQVEALIKAGEDAIGMLDEAKLPLPLRIITWITGGVGIVLAGGILEAVTEEEGVSLATAYANAPWAFWIAGVCLVAWVILCAVGRKKEKEVLNEADSNRMVGRMEGVAKNIFMELGVPVSAPEVDILTFRYKMNGEEPVAKPLLPGVAAYDCLNNRIFADGENLFIADVEGKYAIPLSSLRKIHTVNKKLQMASWNKNVDPDEGIYKPYKLRINDAEEVTMNSYHILELEHEGTLWGIWFPCYELETFERVTGLKARQEIPEK